MATIFNRLNKGGYVTVRVIFRRKGRPSFSTSFDNTCDAEKFVKRYEKKYCLDPYTFVKDMKKLKLRRKWMREFIRKESKTGIGNLND